MKIFNRLTFLVTAVLLCGFSEAARPVSFEQPQTSNPYGQSLILASRQRGATGLQLLQNWQPSQSWQEDDDLQLASALVDVTETLTSASDANWVLEQHNQLQTTLNQEHRLELWVILLGGSAILIGFPALLILLVGYPLRLLANSLATEDVTLIKKLQKSRTEFGVLARLIEQFFAQKAALVNEIEERQRIEAALRQSEERYALAAEGANDGLWAWDLLTNQVYFSKRWKAMLAYTDAEIDSTPQAWLGRIHLEDQDRVWQELADHLEGNNPYFESEYRIQHADGSYRWMLCRGLAVKDASGTPFRVAGSQTDLSNRKALYDPLTQLPNRALFMDRLEQAIKEQRRYPQKDFAVLFLDLDRFKWVNDSLGHLAGDQLLIEIARRLSIVLRPHDTIARLGGDEFAILLRKIDSAESAITVADRIHTQMSEKIDLNGHEIFTATSIGIALSHGQALTATELLRQADAAMYRAKALGRGNSRVYDANMQTSTQNRLHLEAWLRHAIEYQELQLHYQPIVWLNTGLPCGFEALIRWQHPQRGLISPGDFIPIAEETGLIVPIGYWVLRQACQQMLTWNRQFFATEPLSVSVNLSARQLLEPDLAEQIGKILRETGLPPEQLKLEVTEAMLVHNPQTAAIILDELKSLGVEIELDDFGTGYCSLSYLHNFAIDALKIDRSFISEMTNSSKNAAIVRTIMALAESLGIYVVAEGVETAAQRDHLQELNCRYAQGYFFSRPLESAKTTDWINQIKPVPFSIA